MSRVRKYPKTPAQMLELGELPPKIPDHPIMTCGVDWGSSSNGATMALIKQEVEKAQQSRRHDIVFLSTLPPEQDTVRLYERMLGMVRDMVGIPKEQLQPSYGLSRSAAEAIAAHSRMTKFHEAMQEKISLSFFEMQKKSIIDAMLPRKPVYCRILKTRGVQRSGDKRAFKLVWPENVGKFMDDYELPQSGYTKRLRAKIDYANHRADRLPINSNRRLHFQREADRLSDKLATYVCKHLPENHDAY